MTKKMRIAVIFGGRSAEHEISLRSAHNVIAAVDRDKYDVVLVGIDRKGAWHIGDAALGLISDETPLSLEHVKEPVILAASAESGCLVKPGNPSELEHVDVIFPVLHGPYGEDGSVQGLAKLANVACVGCDTLGSSVGMDKDVAKRLLRDAGISVAKHICVRRRDISSDLPEQVTEALGYPVYVKPANMGSSVGVLKVSQAADLLGAIDKALQYDTKVLIEEEVIGRELECAVLGNDNPKASVVGEVSTDDGFYSYEKKYIDESGAVLDIPAKIDEAVQARIQTLAVETFKTLELRGMSRVDMFLTEAGELVINEVNTIPGFTSISMYPSLWQASGLSYSSLIDNLIQLAIDEHNEKKALKTTGY